MDADRAASDDDRAYDCIWYAAWKQVGDVSGIYSDRQAVIFYVFGFHEGGDAFDTFKQCNDQKGLCSKVPVSAFQRDLQLCDISAVAGSFVYRCAGSWSLSDMVPSSGGSAAAEPVPAISGDRHDFRHIFCVLPGSGVYLECCAYADYVYVCDFLLSGETA